MENKGNFGKRFSETFNQHKTLLNAFTLAIHLSKCKACLIFSY